MIRKKVRKLKGRPFGRDEVKAAILDAAERLFAERSASAVTVREIAAAAGVKHTLLHRHFGSKENVIYEVYDRSAARVQQSFAGFTTIRGHLSGLWSAMEANQARRVTVARALLDGMDPKRFQRGFPAMRHFLELLRKEQKDTTVEPEVVAAALSALAHGWFLLEPFLVAQTGLDQRPKDVVRFLERIIDSIC